MPVGVGHEFYWLFEDNFVFGLLYKVFIMGELYHSLVRFKSFGILYRANF